MAMIEPAHVDWTQVDDSEVWHAAQTGVREAIAEARRRGLDKPA
jgi:hypothetical protein